MDDKEQADLDQLKKDMAAIKIKAYDYMLAASKYSPLEMKHSGYEKFTHGEMLLDILYRYQGDIDKAMKAHLKKYPD